MGHSTNYICKVANLLWFVQFGMRIGGDAQLIGRSHPVDHTSVLLIIQLNLGSPKASFFGGGVDYNKIKMFIHAHFPPQH